MVEVNENVKHLLSLFEHRTKMVEACTRKITRFLDPLITTIKRMLGVNDESFTIKHVEAEDDVMLISFVVSYDPNSEMTPYLKLLHTNTPDIAVREVTRTLSLGIPISVAVGDQEETERWLMQIARDTFDPDRTAVPEKTEAEQRAPEPPPKDSTAFDPSQLTAEQASQLLYFQQHTKGMKQ